MAAESSFVPEFDPDFLPAFAWHRAFSARAAAEGGVPAALTLERPGGGVARHDFRLLPDTETHGAENFRCVERLAKFLLWSRGGVRLRLAAPASLARRLATEYAPGGSRAFDAQTMRTIYGHDLSIEHALAEELPEAHETESPLGNHWNGCRIGFDLGGSNCKVVALIEGSVVFSEICPWKPYFQDDPEYHRSAIHGLLRRAAAALPRVDGIGGSAAGVFFGNLPVLSSLFRGVAIRDAQAIFTEISRLFPGASIAIRNDGEVTALAGAVRYKRKKLLGLSMGTSEAAGYVAPGGGLFDRLDELAFAPIDYRADAPCDEWSGDAGCGVSYLSRTGLERLARHAGFSGPDALNPEDPRTMSVYRSLGAYLGNALLHYRTFYDFDALLLLGGILHGGAEHVAKTAEEISGVPILLPDSEFRRRGQAEIAASLPLVLG